MKNNFIHIMKTSKDKKYIFLKKRSYDYKNYQIIPLRYDDIIKIKEWRNEQITILRQLENTYNYNKPGVTFTQLC